MKITIKPIYSVFTVVTLAMAAVIADGAPGDLFASVNGNGTNRGGSIYQFTPDGGQTIFASGLARPRGLAFDSAGNLFVATTYRAHGQYHAKIVKITPDGTQSVFATMPISFFGEGLAIDTSENVFVVGVEAFYLSEVFKFTPRGVGTLFGFLGQPRSQGFGLALDSAGNLFAADAVRQIIYKFSPDGKRTIVVGPEAFGDVGGPIGIAFDQSGNLFVSVVDLADVGQIFEFDASGSKTTFATGLTNPRGLVFDSGGNLFVAELPAFETGDILKFTPDGMRAVFASGIGDPTGIYSGPEFLTIEPR